MEGKVFLRGPWKSYQELEDSISIDELIFTYNKIAEEEFEDKKFTAALKGINLEGEKENPLDVARRKRNATILKDTTGKEVKFDDSDAVLSGLFPGYKING